MCGIGMLTLTGNTISMDVFGPVADNANGIGEMGLTRPRRNGTLPGEPATCRPKTKHARQILADLDAVGNTTKADHQGHRHRLGGHRGRVALRQLHRRAGRPASEEKIGQLPIGDFISRRVEAHGRRADGVHRHADRRRGAVPVQLDD